jgi:hypothetical protein
MELLRREASQRKRRRGICPLKKTGRTALH